MQEVQKYSQFWGVKQRWFLVTDVSGQLVCLIFTIQTVDTCRWDREAVPKRR